ncbi:MAG: gluconate transporter [Arsenophonus sp.]|nr:gluconate transporter [Arsenophonus sp.]
MNTPIPETLNMLVLTLTVAGAVFLLLFLVMYARLHAFIALMVVSILAGLFSGMPVKKIIETMQEGMAGTLGFLAIVVALGAMFGRILHETGALEQIAIKLINCFGEKRTNLAIGITGLIYALPLFFDVAIVLLIGIVFTITNRLGGNVVKTAIPLFAGVAAAAAFLLPGPTPMLVAFQMNADFGWMILIGVCAAIPAMLIAGLLFGNFISRHVFIALPENYQGNESKKGKMSSFMFSLLIVLFPLALVGLKTLSSYFLVKGSDAEHWLEFIGHPFIALLLACLLAIYDLGLRYGMNREKVMEICSAAIQPAGIILLITGAGGVFKQVLVNSGVGPVLGNALMNTGLPIALACFVLAAAVRIIQGSVTVACLTTIGLILLVISELGYSGAQLAALAVCISGGSIVLSHVNDSGFWLFSKFTGATEGQTLKTWTLMETILGTVGAIIGMLFFIFL